MILNYWISLLDNHYIYLGVNYYYEFPFFAKFELLLNVKFNPSLKFIMMVNILYLKFKLYKLWQLIRLKVSRTSIYPRLQAKFYNVMNSKYLPGSTNVKFIPQTPIQNILWVKTVSLVHIKRNKIRKYIGLHRW